MWLRQCAVIVLFALSITIQGQQPDRHNKRRYVIVPSDTVVLAVASQADCPVKFENAKLVTSADGDGPWGATYAVRNVGTIAVSSFTAVLWTSYGTGGTLTGPGQFEKGPLLPGQIIKTGDDEIVPLTDELRDKLNLRPPVRAVVILMIEKVRFADGSVYDAQSGSQALLTYFESMTSKRKK